MMQKIIGKRVRWHSVNRIRMGVVVADFRRKKDNEFLGYLVQMDDGRYVIANPKSIVLCEDPDHS